MTMTAVKQAQSGPGNYRFRIWYRPQHAWPQPVDTSTCHLGFRLIGI